MKPKKDDLELATFTLLNPDFSIGAKQTEEPKQENQDSKVQFQQKFDKI